MSEKKTYDWSKVKGDIMKNYKENFKKYQSDKDRDDLKKPADLKEGEYIYEMDDADPEEVEEFIKTH